MHGIGNAARLPIGILADIDKERALVEQGFRGLGIDGGSAINRDTQPLLDPDDI